MSSRFLRRPFLCAGLVLVAAALLEGGARALDSLRGRPFESEHCRAEARRICDALAQESSTLPAPDRTMAAGAEGKILHPYTAWELTGLQRRAALDVEHYDRAQGTALDVCLLGGAAARAFERTGAARFAGALGRAARFQGRSVRVHDYSCPGYKQPQMSKQLAWLLALGHRPDAVVEVDGEEEIDLAEKNVIAGTNPGFPSIEAWRDAAGEMRSDWEIVERMHRIRELRDRTRAFGEWMLDRGLWKSCFLGDLAVSRLHSLERARRESLDELGAYVRSRPSEEFIGPAFDRNASGASDAFGDCWERAARNLRGMCSARGIPFVLVVLDPRLSGRAASLREKGVAVVEASGIDDDLADALAGALDSFASR